MKNVIVASRDERGLMESGAIVVRSGQRHVSVQRMVVDQGIAAYKSLPEGSSQRAKVVAWVDRAANQWPLDPGEYPLVGKAAIVIRSHSITEYQDLIREQDYVRAMFGSGQASEARTPAISLAQAKADNAKAFAAVAKAKAALRK